MENKNLLIAFLACFGIMYVYDIFFPSRPTPIETHQTDTASIDTKKSTDIATVVTPLAVKKEPLKFTINSNTMCGTLVIDGDKISGINMKLFKEKTKSDEPVNLLSDSNYTVSCGFEINNQPLSFAWDSARDAKLSPNSPITVFANISNSLKISRTISIDENYMVTVSTEVTNLSDGIFNFREKNIITKTLTDQDSGGTWTLNEGASGYLNGDLIEHNFDDIKKKNFNYFGHIDWAGLTDKYWLTAIINPDCKNFYNINYKLLKDDTKYPSYIAIFSGNIIKLEPGKTCTFVSKIFVGPKDISILDEYEKQLHIKHLDLALDYGKLYFITKPALYFVNYVNSLVGNMGWTIFLLTLLLKLLLFPFANKSYKSMARMRVVQPKIKALQKMYENDKQRLGQEMMMLYKREKVNPLGGCLPSLMQFPILFALYKVLMICFGMRHASFLWIDDLAAPEPYSIFNLFGLLPFDVPGFLMIGTWALLMGGSMFLQQKLTPQVASDPQQEKMFMFMPVFLMFMMSGFPVGLLIYWTISNVLSIIQQYYVTRFYQPKNS